MVEIVLFCEFAVFEMAITFSRGEDRHSRAPRWIREILSFQKTPFSRSELIRIGQGPKYGGGGKPWVGIYIYSRKYGGCHICCALTRSRFGVERAAELSKNFRPPSAAHFFNIGYRAARCSKNVQKRVFFLFYVASTVLCRYRDGKNSEKTRVFGSERNYTWVRQLWVSVLYFDGRTGWVWSNA